MKFQWLGRRWVEFTRGYTGYITFLFNLSNFIIILYALVPEIKENISFPFFVTGIIVILFPVAILIGHIHFRKQYPIETGISIFKNPWTYKLIPNSKEERSYEIQLAILEELHFQATDKRKEGMEKAISQCKNILAGNDTREIPE